MADSKISALTAATAPAATDEHVINQGGTTKKVTNTVLFSAIPVAVAMGSATVDCSTLTMIKGAQTSDPQVQLALSADALGDFSITTDTGGIALNSAAEIDFVNSNITYVPIGLTAAQINAYITAATSGDTLILAAGTYSVDASIGVTKVLKIKGQGKGITTIDATTTLLGVFLGSFSNITIEDLSITCDSAGLNYGIYYNGDNLTGGKINNVDVVLNASNIQRAFVTANCDVTFRNCTWDVTSSDNAADGLYARNTATADATRNVYAYNCSGTVNGTTSNGIASNDSSATQDIILHSYDCHSVAIGATSYGAATTSGVDALINIYGGSYSGASADVAVASGGTLTVYDTVLVNNTTSGTITYAGTVVTSDLYIPEVFETKDSFADNSSYTSSGKLLEEMTTPICLYNWTTPATTELDQTENSHSLTYQGTMTTADQIHKGFVWALDFDAGDDYLTTPDAADLSFGDGSNDEAVTFFGWIEVVATATNQIIMAKWSANVNEWQVNIQSTEVLTLQIYDESVSVQSYRKTDSALSVGWHFFAITYDGTGGATALGGTNCVMYVDGLAVASTATDDGSYVAMEPSTELMLVGASTSGTPAYFFQGDMGQIGIDQSEWDAAKVWRAYTKTRGDYNL